MGKVLKILGICALTVVVFLAVTLFWAHSAGGEVQERFFQAVHTGDTQKVLALCHPELVREIDPPVLEQWMEGFNEKMGQYKGLSPSGFHTSSSIRNGQKNLESNGVVEFENGQADVQIALKNDKVIAFRVEAGLDADNWFDPPRPYYQNLSGEMFSKLFGGQIAQARRMMHENLRAKLPEAELTEQVAEIGKQLGTFKGVTWTGEEYQPTEPQTLILTGEIEFEQGRRPVYVKYVFNGLKGYLLGWSMKI